MQGKVSVGLSTVTGYGVTTAAFVGAVLAYLGGDHSNQTVAIIACGVVGAIAFMVTNIGRQRQAVAITHAAAYGPVVSLAEPASNAGDVITQGTQDPLPKDLVGLEHDGPVTDTGDAEAAPNV